MWRKSYFLLALIRLYFAFSPSYIHPDEHFQGPEVIAGEVFGWPTHQTWEFTSSKPIRSLFPLWLVYGWPLTIFKWIWEGLGYIDGDNNNSDVPPQFAFYVLRALMFTLSFVLEDWALHELLPSPRERRTAIILVASSYVTWTFQTHTFSNSIETLVVLWCIVLIRRIRDDRERTHATACAVLAFLGVLGVFNRITFPAFLLLPSIQLVPHLFSKPLSILIIALAGLSTIFLAIWTDTAFYEPSAIHLDNLRSHAIITPLNNLLYNLDTTNLAQHGLHPFWQHLGANLPQLLGPAYPLLFLSNSKHDLYFWTGITGTALLSCFAHQEARFLLPAVPLLLSSIALPRRMPRLWIGSWILFNALGALVFGIYHQGGIVPAQTWLATQHEISGQAFWWKTYSPPRWLLDGKAAEIETVDLMGVPGEAMMERVMAAAQVCDERNQTLLVAPSSASFLDIYTASEGETAAREGVKFEQLWHYRQHLNLDDMDFGDDGVRATLERVIGRRGLTVWRVRGQC